MSANHITWPAVPEIAGDKLKTRVSTSCSMHAAAKTAALTGILLDIMRSIRQLGATQDSQGTRVQQSVQKNQGGDRASPTASSIYGHGNMGSLEVLSCKDRNSQVFQLSHCRPGCRHCARELAVAIEGPAVVKDINLMSLNSLIIAPQQPKLMRRMVVPQATAAILQNPNTASAVRALGRT
jgi:hypothetical protein